MTRQYPDPFPTPSSDRGSAGASSVLVVNAGFAESVERDVRLWEFVRGLELSGVVVSCSPKRRTTVEIVRLVTSSDADALVLVGFSIMSTSHLTVIPRVMRALEGSPRSGIPVFVAGDFTDEDADQLRTRGVSHVFTLGIVFPATVERLKSVPIRQISPT
jgi:methylmalonyl-CoA mutase cobalamin-binding domain/chain